MPRGETENHRRLKTLAQAWAAAEGLGVAACEVPVPRSGFRADVVAAAPDGSRTAVFECKQSRADLLKDAHDLSVTRQRIHELAERRVALEGLLAVHHPECRRGVSLFAEYDEWDFSPVRHEGYRRLRSSQAVLRRRVREGTKFSRMTRYCCADRLYLVVEDGLHAPAEVPDGWGVLVRGADGLHLLRAARALEMAPAQRAALCDRLARVRARATDEAASARVA